MLLKHVSSETPYGRPVVGPQRLMRDVLRKAYR